MAQPVNPLPGDITNVVFYDAVEVVNENDPYIRATLTTRSGHSFTVDSGQPRSLPISFSTGLPVISAGYENQLTRGFTLMMNAYYACEVLKTSRPRLSRGGEARAVEVASGTLRSLRQGSIVHSTTWDSFKHIESNTRDELATLVLPLFQVPGVNGRFIVARCPALDAILLDISAEGTYWNVYMSTSTNQGTLRAIEATAHRYGRLPQNATVAQVRNWAMGHDVLKWSDWDFSNGTIRYLVPANAQPAPVFNPLPAAAPQAALVSGPPALPAPPVNAASATLQQAAQRSAVFVPQGPATFAPALRYQNPVDNDQDSEAMDTSSDP